MSRFSIFNTRGSQIVEPREELLLRFETAAKFIPNGTSKEGRFLLEENISVVKSGELVNGQVVFCALDQPDLRVSSDADFYAKSCLLFYQVELPSEMAGEHISLRFLGTSHDVEIPDWVSESVMMKTESVYLSVGQGSVLDKIVENLVGDMQASKRHKGENSSSNSKSSGDDNKTVVDKDGTVHSSSNQKRDVDRIKDWTSLMRLTSESYRLMYMGNDGIPNMNPEEIIRRLDVMRSVAMLRDDTDPLKSVASVENIAYLEVIKDEKKTMNFLLFDVQRTKPLHLALPDFYDGKRSEVYPPSGTDLCDQNVVERISRMFVGLERSLAALCDPSYKGVFTQFRDKLSQPSFVGRRHTVAFVLDVLQSPLFALSIRLREDKALDGSLRGPIKVRAILIAAYEALVIPNYSGDWQSREFDYLNTTFKRITWTGVAPVTPRVSTQPAADANSQLSSTNSVQGSLSNNQLKKILKQAKTPAGASHASSNPGNASNAGGGLSTSSTGQHSGTASGQLSATKTGQGLLCLRHLAQLLGVQGQACMSHPCKFVHEVLKDTSKAGTVAAIEKLKSFPAGIDKADMLARIAKSTSMAK